MSKVKIKELPKQKKVTEDELRAIKGGAVTPVSPNVKGVGILMCAKQS